MYNFIRDPRSRLATGNRSVEISAISDGGGGQLSIFMATNVALSLDIVGVLGLGPLFGGVY